MATQTNKETVQLSLKIDGKEAINTVQELDAKSSALVKEMRQLEDAGQQATEAYRKLEVQRKELIKQSNTAYEASKKAAEQQARLSVNEGKSLKALQGEYRQLNAIIANLPPTHKDFNSNVELLHKKKAKIDEIKSSFRSIVNEVDKSSKATGGFLGMLKSGAGAVAAFFAVGKLVQWGKQVLGLYDEAARGEAQLQAVIKSTSGAAGRSVEQLKRQQEELQRLTLFDDDATAQSQALLLTFTKVRQDVFDASIPIIQDYATSIATAGKTTVDLDGATKLIGKTLQDPIAGLGKLTKAGVVFTDQQKEQIKAFQESGRLADAQRIILKQLEVQYGGSARAAAEAGTGGLKQLENRFNNLLEVFGEFVFRRLEPLLALGGRVLGFFEDLVDPVQAAASAFDDQAAKVKDLEDNLVPLLGRYDELKGKTNLTKIEQDELKKIVDQVAAAVPSAVTAFGKYGEALDINTEAARHFIEIEKARLQFIHQDAIASIENQIRTMETLRDRTLALRKAGGELAATGSGLTGSIKKFTEDELRGMDEEMGKIKFSIEGANAELARLKGEGFALPDAPIKSPGGGGGDGAGGGGATKSLFDLREKELQAFFDRENLLIAGAVLKAEITEQEGVQRRLDNQRSYYQAQLGLLETFGQQNTNKYIEVTNKLLDVQNQQEQQAALLAEQLTVEGIANLGIKAVESESKKNLALLRVQEIAQAQSEESKKAFLKREEDNAKRTADVIAQIERNKLQLANDAISGAIELLSVDEKARKKHAAAIKAFEVSRIYVNLFSEISGYFKGYADLPFIGQAIAIAQSVVATVRAQAAVSKIANQKYAKGGVPQGAGHDQGGIQLFDTRSRTVVGEMEGGEPILSRTTYKNNKPIIDRLLFSSMHRGGAPIFATGGFSPGAANIASQVSINQSNQRNEEMQMALLEETMRTRQAIEAIPTTLKADVSLRTIQDADQTLGDIRKAAAL